MPSFSERHGLTAPRSVVQKEDLDPDTRMDVWNVLFVLPGLELTRGHPTEHHAFCMGIWTNYFRNARDAFPGTVHVWGLIKESVLDDPWNEVFDLLEYMIRGMSFSFTGNMSKIGENVASALNDVFERDLVGYRFIGHEVTPVDSDAESSAISEALDSVEGLEGARHSLSRAIELLADRQTPDYPNSIKESISAVEAVVKKVTGEGTLGSGLRRLEQTGLAIHPALREAWLKMYGWASDADGIRHAGINAADADQAIAKYVLVTCSAFVSYLVEEGRKTGLL